MKTQNNKAKSTRSSPVSQMLAYDPLKNYDKRLLSLRIIRALAIGLNIGPLKNLLFKTMKEDGSSHEAASAEILALQESYRSHALAIGVFVGLIGYMIRGKGYVLGAILLYLGLIFIATQLFPSWVPTEEPEESLNPEYNSSNLDAVKNESAK